jgi:hypothetical protein
VDKDVEAFRTISEVGEELDLPQHVLRFWETRFPQIRPVKRGGGRRYYRPEDCDLLRGIKHLLYGEGYTIKGVQRILKEEGPRTVQAVGRAGLVPASTSRKQPPPAFEVPIEPAVEDDDAIDLASPLSRREPIVPKAAFDRDAGVKDAASRRTAEPSRPLSLEPHVDPRPTAKAQDTAVAGEKRHIEPVMAPIGSERRQPRVDPAAPALPGFEPVAVPAGAQRKVKPKQLALFEGMEEEGLSSKDREALRQVLEKIAECRKLIASADIMETVTPHFADL